MTALLDANADLPPAVADIPVDPPGTAAPTGRVAAIDIARGVALLGMLAVHVPYLAERPHGAWDAILEAPSGRASVLFFMLSGVSLSLIARRGSTSAETPTLVARGALLLLFGLVMSQFWFGSSILVQYGFVFLLAPWLLRRHARSLLAIAGATLLLGPVLVELFEINATLWISSYAGITTGWLGQTVASALFSVHALVVWLGFFCIGMLVGRLDLTRRRHAARTLGLGVALAAAATLVITSTDHLVPAVDEIAADGIAFAEIAAEGSATDESMLDGSALDDLAFDESGSFPVDEGSWEFAWTDPQWSNLWSGEPHANTTPWALQSAGIAMAVIGLLALLPGVATRLLAPLGALGSISLTAYVFHPILVQDAWEWTDPISSSFAWEIARVVIAWALLMALAWLIKRRWRQGPLEWALHRLSAGAGT